VPGRLLQILTALLCGALIGVAIVYLVSKNPPRVQLVGGQPLSYWLMCLDSEKPEFCKAADTNLPLFGAAAAAPVIERLDSSQPTTANAALWTLTRLGPAAAPAMTEALKTGSAPRRLILIKRLQVLGAKTSERAAPQIAAYLDDPQLSAVAERYFVSLGPTRDAIAVSTRILQGPDHVCRINAIKVIAEAAATNDPRAAVALVEEMKTTDREVLLAARAALVRMPNPPDEFIRFMVDRFADMDHKDVYDSGAYLLTAGPRAEYQLGRLWQHPDVSVRVAAVGLLEQIAWANRGDPTTLKLFLGDPSPSVHLRAESAIGELKIRFGGRLAIAGRKPTARTSDVPRSVR
jgi:hypothetical protein